jgi:hypothetical protein
MENKNLERRQFLKLAAGTGIAVSILSNPIAKAVTTEKSIEPGKPELNGKKIAFFVNCCICPDQSNSEFVLWQAAKPIGPVIEKIRAKARQLDAPMLSITCLGAQRAHPEMSVKDAVSKGRAKKADKPDMAFVGLNATDKEVQDALLCRQIFLERKGYPTPEENVKKNSTNVFLFNLNAAKIVKALGDRQWIVCGRSFSGCTTQTIVGLLALGKKVTVLQDAILGSGDNAGGDFDRSVEYLKSLGAKFARTDSVLG